tara:strand:- start:104 stop:625 length:522 start_codon:yes stop_codon:yes gene_type:complete
MKKEVKKVLPLFLIIPTLYFAFLSLESSVLYEKLFLTPVVILLILAIVNKKNNILFDLASAYTLTLVVLSIPVIFQIFDFSAENILLTSYIAGLSIFIWISGFFDGSFFKTIFFGYLVEKWRRLTRVSVIILILYLYYVNFYEQFYNMLYGFLFYIGVYFISWLFEPFFKKTK